MKLFLFRSGLKNKLETFFADKLDNGVGVNSIKNELNQMRADKLKDNARMKKLEEEINRLKGSYMLSS